MASPLPSTMKAWLYSTTTGGLEKNLSLDPNARVPNAPSKGQVIVKVISASINPADYKVPEQSTVAGKVLIATTPATPGMDFCGQVVANGDPQDEKFAPGQLVFGCLGMPRQFGALGEYLLGYTDNLAPLPEGLDPDDAATVGVAGRTAYQSIAPYVSSTGTQQDKVFINGGSGGCGIFAIQFAKLLGCHVTTTCSTRNVQFCRDLGADEVIDYTDVDVVETLKAKGQVFDHVVDHIGIPDDLYRESHAFLRPGKAFVQVGSHSMLTFARRLVRPSFLGGGQRKYVILLMKNSAEDLVRVGDYIKEGKVRVEIDSVWEFEDTVKAFEKLRSGRARGKIVIHVSKKS